MSELPENSAALGQTVKSSKVASRKPGKSASKSARSRAREFALQALYQVLVGKNEASDIDVFTRDLSGFHKADSAHYDALLYGCAEQASELDKLILPLLDRSMAEISPIDRATMWIGVCEMKHCLDGPWRVLEGLAPQLRPHEVQADRQAGRARA